MVLPAVLVVVLATFSMLLLADGSSAEGYPPVGPKEFRSQWGWHEGDRVEYFDMGRASNTTAPVYRAVDEAGDPVEGQRLIFRDLRSGILVGAPFSPNYSDFHRVWDVQVPSDYMPDTLRSFEDLVEADLTMVQREVVLNIPMVPQGSTLVGSEADSHPLLRGWWGGQTVWYFRFGSSRDTPGLFDARSGLVRDSRMLVAYDPPGQLDILEDYPGDATYSPLSRPFIFTTISGTYVPDTVRSVEEVEALEVPIVPAGGLFNRPVVGGREQHPRYEHSPPSRYNLLEAWYGPTSKVLYYDMGPMTDGVAPLYRFVNEEGDPIQLQYPLVEAVAPGMLEGDVDTSAYSTLWRVHHVVVGDVDSFDPNVVKSMADVRDMGLPVNTTEEYVVAPMITRDAVFLPMPSRPPGELVRAWYNGADVYLVRLGNGSLVSPGTDGEDPHVRTSNLTVVLDPEGEPYPDQLPILETVETEANYSAVWSRVGAFGGEGYRPDRFRSREQLRERGWSFRASGAMVLGGFVAGPTNVPAWRPETFAFQVGPVVDEEGRPLKGADVRVVSNIDVLEGRTGGDGTVTFEVGHAWNGKTVQTFISEEGFDSIQFSAEIVDYEFFVPLGGYVPPMARSDAGGGLGPMAVIALAFVAVIALAIVVVLLWGRAHHEPTITEEEADEIFSDEGPGDEGGPDEEVAPPGGKS